MKVRRHIFFTGKVQRVGFRNTSARLAISLGLTGWVRNLPDGRVELLAEGLPSQLDSLVSQLDSLFAITQKETGESAATDEFPGFEVLR